MFSSEVYDFLVDVKKNEGEYEKVTRTEYKHTLMSEI